MLDVNGCQGGVQLHLPYAAGHQYGYCSMYRSGLNYLHVFHYAVRINSVFWSNVYYLLCDFPYNIYDISKQNLTGNMMNGFNRILQNTSAAIAPKQ